MFANSSAEGSNLRTQLLVHKGAEQGAGRGTVSVANQGDVSTIVRSVDVRCSRPGILLRLEGRLVGYAYDEVGLANIEETLGGRIRDSVDAEWRRRVNVVVVGRLGGVVDE